MNVQELIKEFSNEQGFQFGIDIVMKALRPNSIYCLSSKNGNFEIVNWDKSNKMPQPTSEEIKEEYIRHKTIKEVLDYLKEDK